MAKPSLHAVARIAVPWLLGASLLPWSRGARGEPFALTYSAPAGCPTQASLLAQVLARAASINGSDTSSGFQFDAHVEVQSSGTFVGTLGLRRADGFATSRSVDGNSCEEVVAALSLIIALTLEHRAGEDAPVAVAPQPDSSMPAVPTTPALPDEHLVRQTQSLPARATAGRMPQPMNASAAALPNSGARPTAQTPAPLGAPWHTQANTASLQRSSMRFGVGAQGEWLTPLAPAGGMVLIGAHAEVGKIGRPSVAIGGAIGPTVRRSDSRDVAAETSYIGGEIELAVPFLGSERAGVDGLAITSAGQLRARGVPQGRISAVRESTLAWVGIGPGLSVYRRFSHAKLAVQVAVPMSLVRPRLLLDHPNAPSDALYETPLAGLYLSLRATWENVDQTEYR